MRVSKEFKVGLLVILGLLAIYTLVTVLKGGSFWGGDREFYAEFKNSAGLEASNAVLVNGVTVGQVIEVGLHPQKVDRVLVKFSVQDDELQIPNTSEVWLVSSDILGTKALELKLDTMASKNPQYYEHGDTIVAKSEQTLEDQINEQILPLKKKTEDLIASVEHIVVSINSFWDTSAAFTIDESLYEVRDAIGQFGELADRLSELVSKETAVIDKVLHDVSDITGTIVDKRDQLTRTLDNLDSISTDLKDAELSATVDTVKMALSEFTDVLEKINSGEGSVGKLLHTTELHDELLKTNISLQNLLNDLENNPNKYVHFSLFGRKVKGYSTTQEREDILDGMLDSLQFQRRSPN